MGYQFHMADKPNLYIVIIGVGKPTLEGLRAYTRGKL